jgi:hypothetical protein
MERPCAVSQQYCWGRYFQQRFFNDAMLNPAAGFSTRSQVKKMAYK